jgi:hypothetical protein|tara:strand:+ start:1492 stop:1794 length:303 start_codon:yes stop_codon:yes gene_type:complete
MATYKDRVVKSVTHYEPGSPPDNPEQLPVYVVEELKSLADVVLNQAIFRLERTHVEPEKPRGGDIRYASGNASPITGSWNPGSGEGIYFFNETTQAWVKL